MFAVAQFTGISFAAGFDSSAGIDISGETLRENKSQRGAIGRMLKVKKRWINVIAPINATRILTTGLASGRDISLREFRKHSFKKKILKNSNRYLTEGFVHIPKTKRPFVVILGGVSNNSRMAGFRNFAFPMSEYYGWGVAVLENASSAEWSNRNHHLLVTGYEAGWDLYQKLLQLRRDPEIGPKISELHVVGLSLGGNDLLYASYFDSILKTHIIDGSALAWNSPSNRFKAFDGVRRKNRGLVALAVRHIIGGLFKATVGLIKRFIKVDKDEFVSELPTEKLMKDLYIKYTELYLSQNEELVSIMEEDGLLLTSNTKLVSFDSYKRMMVLNDGMLSKIKTPLLFVENRNDPVVNFGSVSNDFRRRDLPKNIALADYKRGGHLGNIYIYGKKWQYKTLISYMSYWGSYSYKYYMQWQNKAKCIVRAKDPDDEKTDFLSILLNKQKEVRSWNICNLKGV